ncbi:MAG: RNA polymerase sigma factor, partial [Planctomycetota bacterium]
MKSISSTDPILAQLDWVRGLCLRLVRDVAAADDLVQEIWLVAQAKLPTEVQGEARTRGWLAGVAKNLARNRGRAEASRRERERSRASEIEKTSDGVQASDDLLARSEVLKLVADGVLQLDEPFRRAMLLRWFEGHSPKEIARLEGTSRGTVHSRLNRGQEKVRAWMNETHPGSERDWAIALVPAAAKAVTLKSGAAMGSGKLLTLAVVGLGAMGASAGWFVLGPAPSESGSSDAAQSRLASGAHAPEVSLASRDATSGPGVASLDAATKGRQAATALPAPPDVELPDDLRVHLIDHL